MIADSQIVRRCQAGDPGAFGILYEAYRAPAYLLALQLTGNKEDALDACQTAFTKAFKAMGGFDAEREFRPWLFTIVRNFCVDLLRKRRPDRSLTPEHDVPDPAPGPLALAEATDTQRRTARALEELSPAHREIILMKDFHDLSYKEIAEVLDIPIGTVMSRLSSARNKLREALGGPL